MLTINIVSFLIKQSNNTISAFDTTLKNISGYLDFNKEATLKLRINYTHDNLTPQKACKMDSFDIKLEEGIINYINESYAVPHN